MDNPPGADSAVEEGTVAGTVRAFARSTIISLLRIAPRIPAIKFFRPRLVKTAEKVPLAARVSHSAPQLIGGVALFTVYGLVVQHENKLFFANKDGSFSTSGPEHLQPVKLSLPGVAVAGALGGAVHTLLSAPLIPMHRAGMFPCGEAARQTLVSSWRSVLTSSSRIKGLYQGALPLFVRDVVGFALFFTSFELIHERLSRSDEEKQRMKCDAVAGGSWFSVQDAMAALVAGATAGLLYEFIAYPIDNARKFVVCAPHDPNRAVALQRQGLPYTKPTVWSVLKDTPKPYARFLSHALRTMPISALTFLAYEIAVEAMEHHAQHA